MNVYEMIEAKPSLHVYGDGRPRFMSLGEQALKWMADELSVRKNAVTLETGYGLTTVLMTMLSQKHYAVAPDEPGFKRVLRYCEENGIASESLNYIVGCSEDILPSLSIQDESLDMVLIDGGHGFPTPFVDYAYTFKKVKIGGHLVVDDTQLVTGMLLKDFLSNSEEWRLVKFLGLKTCIFSKEKTTLGRDWSHQTYMIQMNDAVNVIVASKGRYILEKLCLSPTISSEPGSGYSTLPTDALLLRVVIERLQALFQKKIVQVAVFGAGKHTEWLERIVTGNENIPKVTAVLDDFPGDKPKRFGLKPVAAAEFNPRHVDAIVLSSDCLQKNMWERCRALYGNTVKLVDLYDGLPPGPYEKE